jgi:hypothetical protein
VLLISTNGCCSDVLLFSSELVVFRSESSADLSDFRLSRGVSG